MTKVIDTLGNQIQVKDYNRIVSLVPSITETLFDFGLTKRIIGVTRYCNYPKEAKLPPRTIIGGTKSIQVNKIINLNPDLVIANKEENEKDRIMKLIDKGLNVFVTFPQNVFEGLEMMKSLYNLLQVNSNSVYNKFIQYTVDLISTVKSSVELLSTRPRIFCPIWKDPWMSINSKTFINSIIELCGGENIFSDHKDRYPQVTIEEIKMLQPDLILLPDEPFVFSNEHVLELQGLLNSKTVKYLLLNGSNLSWYGTRMIKGIQELSKIIQNQISP